MFTHYGKRRTPRHNLQIASLLSFVAGLVNVTGFLAISKLTTNVTGHFAFFIDEVFRLHFWQGFICFLFIFFFFLGSFFSSLLVELISRKNESYVYIIPVTIESVILCLMALFGKSWINTHPNVIAFGLLFAMGLQNSLVTRISNATIRTTHLTGLFTDLGIECSQLFFYKQQDAREKLISSIRLRLTIIGFFFTGGITGGIFYSRIGINVLLTGSILLIFGIIYDSIVVRMKLLKRSINRKM